jgi:hypothetical protein
VSPTTAGSRQHPGVPPRPLRPPPGELVVVGAHGGAGVTTMAALLRPAWDLGVLRPAGPLRPEGRPVVLVTRSTAPGAARAVAAVRLLGQQYVRVAVLAVIGDGLPEPAEARYRFRVLDGRVGAVVRVPFVPTFRVAAGPLAVRLPRRARRALTEIQALAQERAP